MKDIFKTVLLFLSICLFVTSCKQQENKVDVEKSKVVQNKIETLLERLSNSQGKDVMVIAHRSDWRNFPENSLEAMQSSIKMGVDMIEIDLAKTKDSQLIVMHDRKLDRTTTGKGLVSDWTLDSIRTIYLKNGVGIATKYKVPTLEEALNLCKGKILINLDKSYDYFHQVLDVANKTGTTHQIVVKGFNKSVEEVHSDLENGLNDIIYMPVVNLDKQEKAMEVVEAYQKELKVKAFEFVFSQDTSQVINQFSKIKSNGSRVWVNALWGSLNANHEDNLAVDDLENTYGWYIKKGVNMIQTDRPQLLLDYLRSKGLHE